MIIKKQSLQVTFHVKAKKMKITVKNNANYTLKSLCFYTTVYKSRVTVETNRLIHVIFHSKVSEKLGKLPEL